MSNAPQQLTNSALYLLPIVLGNMVPIITLPIFTRLLTAEDFGAWALASAYASVVGGVASAGLPVAYDRNFFQYPEAAGRARLLYSVIAFTTATFLVCALVTWTFRLRITDAIIGAPGYDTLIVWTVCSTAVVGVKSYYLAYLRNAEQAGLFASYTIAERLLAAVLTVALVAWARAGVVGLVAGQLAASAAVLVVVAARFLRTAAPGFDRQGLGDSLKLGFPLMPRILFGVVGSNFDKYFLAQIASLGGVGIYSIGQRIANIAFTYTTALQNVFGPQVYARMFAGGPGSGASIGRYLTPFAYASTAVSFLIALFAEEILRLLAPPAFHAAIAIITILVLHYALQFFGKMPQIAFARKTYLISVLAGVATAANVGFAAAGIWMWGTIGAAWGALAAGATMTATAFVVGQRCFRIDWEGRKLVAIFGLLFGGAFVTLALRAAGAPYSLLLAFKGLAVVGYALLGQRLGILTAENLALVRDLLLRRARAAAPRAPLSEGGDG